jgi:hypothetical protein
MLPLTMTECQMLADDVREGRRSHAEVRAAMDVDEWFAGCSIDELCQEDVEIVVRWALREHLAGEFRKLPSEGSDFADFIWNGTSTMTSSSERRRAEGATNRLLDELRAINRGDP